MIANVLFKEFIFLDYVFMLLFVELLNMAGITEARLVGSTCHTQDT